MCVIFFVAGSYIASWRPLRWSGNALADGCVEPSLHHAGLSGPRTADVSHRRFFSSSIGLWTLFLLVQITSSPQYGDGAGILGDVGGVFGSRTVSGICEMVLVTGFSTGV